MLNDILLNDYKQHKAHLKSILTKEPVGEVHKELEMTKKIKYTKARKEQTHNFQ